MYDVGSPKLPTSKLARSFALAATLLSSLLVAACHSTGRTELALGGAHDPGLESVGPGGNGSGYDGMEPSSAQPQGHSAFVEIAPGYTCANSSHSQSGYRLALDVSGTSLLANACQSLSTTLPPYPAELSLSPDFLGFGPAILEKASFISSAGDGLVDDSHFNELLCLAHEPEANYPIDLVVQSSPDHATVRARAFLGGGRAILGFPVNRFDSADRLSFQGPNFALDVDLSARSGPEASAPFSATLKTRIDGRIVERSLRCRVAEANGGPRASGGGN